MPLRRGTYRGIHSALLDDVDYQRLSPDARLLLLTVRLCKGAGPAVIFRYYPEVLARQSGLKISRIASLLAELARGRWIEYDEAIVWVRNGLRYDPMVRTSSWKHRRAIEQAISELPKHAIVVRFCEYYEIAKPIDSLRVTYPELALPIPIPSSSLTTTTQIPRGRAIRSAPDFDEFWTAWPPTRRVGKADAVRVWGALHPDDALRRIILAAVGAWKACADWQRENGRYIPYPHRWLMKRRWEDQLPTDSGGDPYAKFPRV